MRNLYWAIIIVLLLYLLDIKPVVAFVDQSVAFILQQWNSLIEFIFTFRDKHPWIYMAIPFAMLYLMIHKGE